MWHKMSKHNGYPSESMDVVVKRNDGSEIECKFVAPKGAFLTHDISATAITDGVAWKRSRRQNYFEPIEIERTVPEKAYPVHLTVDSKIPGYSEGKRKLCRKQIQEIMRQYGYDEGTVENIDDAFCQGFGTARDIIIEFLKIKHESETPAND